MAVSSNSGSAYSIVTQALRRAPSGLFSDFDGTLSYVAETPEQASAASGAIEALSCLRESVACVAIVTGRSAENVRSLVQTPGVTIIGNHGLEQIQGDALVVTEAAQEAVGDISRALERVTAELKRDGLDHGVLFENKGVTGSVHYRLSPDRDRARAAILESVNRASNELGLRVSEGRLVVEIRPALEINKGTAVTRAVTEGGLQGCVYIGDDVTDVDAFRALRTLRSEGVQTASIGVVSPESHPLVAEVADATVESVDACISLLERCCHAL